MCVPDNVHNLNYWTLVEAKLNKYHSSADDKTK